MKHTHYRGKYAARKKHLPLWLWMIPASLLVIGLVAVGMILLSQHHAREDFQQLAAVVRETQAPTLQTTAPTKTTVSTETTVPTETTAPTEPGPLPQYQQLYAQNPEMCGWLRIVDPHCPQFILGILFIIFYAVVKAASESKVTAGIFIKERIVKKYSRIVDGRIP